MRDKIQNDSTNFVVGNRLSGRIYSEHRNKQAAEGRLAQMTDATGYKVLGRLEWEVDPPTPREETEYLLRKMVETFDGMYLDRIEEILKDNRPLRRRIQHMAVELINRL
jgi:hypothetical protein